MDVAAVRAQDLSGDGPEPKSRWWEDEDAVNRDRDFPRLRGCVSGEGEAPLELLLAAAVCAASTGVCGVPVEALRGDAGPTELDFTNHGARRRLGAVGARLLALLVGGNGVLTSLNLCFNR